jgi:hypothetical protein
MLEIEEQWYPPLYAGLLALLPMEWLERHSGKISQSIDLLHGLLIFLAVLWISNSLLVASLSGVSYMMAFFPFSCNTQLQPRGLANLLLTLVMMGLWFYIDSGSLILWSGVLILCVILLFLHKMTVQICVVYLLILGWMARDVMIPLLIPASVSIGIIVSKGFYLKMLRAHWDIVSFWHENIYFLGGHQYYESPRYYKDSSSAELRRKKIRRLLARTVRIFDHNVFVLFLPALVYSAVSSPPGRHEMFLWTWLIVTYLWAFVTTFIPYFMALGEGSYYVYQTFLPMFLLVGLSIHFMPIFLQEWLFGLWAAGIAISIIQWEKYCQSIPHSRTAAIRPDFKEVLEYLKELPKDGVFCISFHLPDAVAYWTRKRVFWGGHSYGFHAFLKPYFPIMREQVTEVLKKEPLNYLVFWRGYLESLKDIGLQEGRHIRYLFGKGEYELYEIIK